MTKREEEVIESFTRAVFRLAQAISHRAAAAAKVVGREANEVNVMTENVHPSLAAVANEVIAVNVNIRAITHRRLSTKPAETL